MANRKLQKEIEIVFKKVDEGVVVFEQIWDKVYSAATPAQKEKYEGDLKKEIKKLQRLRDQIKSWQGDSSIKDKSKLDGYRKLIESKMEKFKICEKETKTKAFSKEGLAQDRTDPKEKAKQDVNEWCGESIGRLQDQREELEAELEAATVASKKKKTGTGQNDRVEQIQKTLERHMYHVEMLEKVLRAVYNETISTDEANDLRDSIDYYLDSNQDPDFLEDETLYDHLDLDAVPVTATIGRKEGDEGGDSEEGGEAGDSGLVERTSGGALDTGSRANSNSANPLESPPAASPSESMNNRENSGSSIVANGSSPLLGSTKGSVAFPAKRSIPMKLPDKPESSSPQSLTSSNSLTHSTSFSKDVRPGSGSIQAANSTGIPKVVATLSSSTKGPIPSASLASVAASVADIKPGGSVKSIATGPAPVDSMPIASPPVAFSSIVKGATAGSAMLGSPATSSPHIQPPNASSTAINPALSNVGPALVAQTSNPQASPVATIPASKALSSQVVAAVVAAAASGEPNAANSVPAASPSVKDALGLGGPTGAPSVIPQGGMTAGGAAGTGPSANLSKDQGPANAAPFDMVRNINISAAALDRAFSLGLPVSLEMELSSAKRKRNVTSGVALGAGQVPVPASFPQKVPPVFENEALFARFSQDTLFYTFYYQQGTYQQYLAAKQLKKQNWRFHKKYYTWFQRHEEPRFATDEYEQGTYVYFDYVLKDENDIGWIQRFKQDFRFEYAYLEDELS
eukprot:CAMPEP_0184707216 /NCGR_PEP_ID=MMETSP0313-20130426/37160_1 /TAXON_ID=2792 /ORGANISM="Porphyridium aerugineum, Strain SAG 1380-2" /LENGTH=742 /DNA_ID=CAMNT_0027168791 /DNA_START=338 /DNA_END=2566 /DNA_ORIENTATION=+